MASTKDTPMRMYNLRQRRTLSKPDVNVQLCEALHYFKNITSRVSLRGNSVLIQHLTTLETIGLQHGIPADGIDILLKLALSGKHVENVNTRILKCLLPATEILEDSVITAVSLFCTGRSSSNTQILFIRWLISVFDVIPCKDVLSSFYNFFFCFLQDDKLCPTLCHLLYLLTKKEHVMAYRVRTLHNLQSRKGLQPHILGLLSIYKVFCPQLVSITLPGRVKMYFKNSNLLFTSELRAITRKNAEDPSGDNRLCLGGSNKPPTRSRKRKWNSCAYIPVCSRNNWDIDTSRVSKNLLSASPTFPVEKLQTFSQLRDNILNIEIINKCDRYAEIEEIKYFFTALYELEQLPAQMGCILQNPLLLNYFSCAPDVDALLRLNYWLAFTLHEECAWYTGKKHNKEDVESFLDNVVNTQEFLQEGLAGTDEFLYRCLPQWNGCHRSKIMCLISWIPLFSFSEIEGLLFQTLTQLFVSSSLYFKLDVLKGLRKLLQNWLIKYSVSREYNIVDMNFTSDLVKCVDGMIEFTGQLCVLGLQMHNSPLLLHFILEFYKLVCDAYMRFSFPLIVLPPPRVFYTALLCTDAVNLNQLCYIMCRYRENLVTAKQYAHQKIFPVPLNISNQTYQLYNQYLTTMVGCLWTSQTFNSDSHPHGFMVPEELLEKTGVPSYKKTFNIVFHPALMSFAAAFLKEGQYWDEYMDFLCNEGMADLKFFIESSVNRVSSTKKSRRNQHPSRS